MSEQATKTESKTSTERCANFTIEFGNSRGQYIAVQTLRQTYRGAFSLSALHKRIGHDGKPMAGRSVGDAMAQIPDTPGIRMEIDFAGSKVREYDPLENDPATLERACKVLGKAKGGVEVAMKPREPRTHALDSHTFKTLIRELSRIVNAGNGTVVLGKLPGAEAINSLPGKFLHDPWNSDPHFRFESEYNAWLDSRRQASASD